MAFFAVLVSVVKECEFGRCYLLDNMYGDYISTMLCYQAKKRAKKVRASYIVWRSCEPKLCTATRNRQARSAGMQ